MKTKINIKLASILLFSFFLLLGALAQDINQDINIKAHGFVNDYAGLLPQDAKDSLERKLSSYEKQTTNEIAIAIIETLDGQDIAQYAPQLLMKWGIGKKESSNGVLIVLSKNERKVFIATGYGLEATLTDAICKRIIENYFVPNFKSGNFYAGLDQGTNVIIKILTGELKAEQLNKETLSDTDLWLLLIVLAFIILSIILGPKSNGRSYYSFGGGGFSSGSGSSFGGFGGGSCGGGGAGGSW